MLKFELGHYQIVTRRFAEFSAQKATREAHQNQQALVRTRLRLSEFSTSFASAVKEPRPRWHAWQLAKGLLVTLAVIASFFAGAPIAEAALVGGSLLLLSRAPSHREKSMPKLMAGFC